MVLGIAAGALGLGALAGGLSAGTRTPSARASRVNPERAINLGQRITLPNINIATPNLRFNLGPSPTGSGSTLETIRRGNLPSAFTNIRGLARNRGGDILSFQRGFVKDINTLLPQIRPGFGRLTESRVQAVVNARRRATGNLRERLAQRRVLGSSFAQDAIARTEREFADAEAQVRAQSFLEELDLTSRLLERQLKTSVAAIQEEFRISSTPDLLEIDQSRFEASEAARLATAFMNQANQSTAVIGDLLAANATNATRASIASAGFESETSGRLFDFGTGLAGTILGPALGRAGSEVEDVIFGPGGA